VTGWIADRREAGSTGQRTTLWKCSVVVLTPSNGCITSSRPEEVGGGNLGSAKLPTAIP
jgi:hypothetical protein